MKQNLELRAWMSFDTYDGNWWMVPQRNLRLSAGVPLRTIRLDVVISSHLGDVLLLERNSTLSFVLLSSFIDGLRAVRQQFERELEEGRRAATTAEERVCNLRKCRERMNAYSDQVVTEHMKVLPVEWTDGVAGTFSSWSTIKNTVLHLTTPDGRLVDSGEETNVAVVGEDRHIIVRLRMDGQIDAEWKNDGSRLDRITPAGGSDICRRKAFGQDIATGGVHTIRFVRDPDSNTDAIQMDELITSDVMVARAMLAVHGGAGATGRWLVLYSEDWHGVTVYNTETDKMATVSTLTRPIGAFETSDGLWMWSDAVDRWSQLFKVEALQSLEYKVPSTLNQPVERVQRRVVDKKLDAEAFDAEACCESTRWPGTFRKEGRHPGHYWVVAGYGPVPASLRAPDHIYKELETFGELRRYEGDFPFWCPIMWTEPWWLKEWPYAQSSPTWAGAVDVRDGVTAESIKEDAKSDTWRVSMRIESEPSGEFSVTGNTLSVLCPFASLEVPVKAGRWLWRVDVCEHRADLILRHESVSEVDTAKCTTPARLIDSRRLEFYLTHLRCLARLIPEEGLRAKIAEFSEEVYAGGASQIFGLFDKNVISEETSGWHVFKDDLDHNKFEVVPLTGGVVIESSHSYSTISVGDNVIRIRSILFENEYYEEDDCFRRRVVEFYGDDRPFFTNSLDSSDDDEDSYFGNDDSF